jgi:hypothetical protein
MPLAPAFAVTIKIDSGLRRNDEQPARTGVSEDQDGFRLAPE